MTGECCRCMCLGRSGACAWAGAVRVAGRLLPALRQSRAEVWIWGKGSTILTVRSKHENNNVCARARPRAARRRAREGEHAELQARMRWHASRARRRQRCAPRLLAVKTTQNPSSHTHKKKVALSRVRCPPEWQRVGAAGGRQRVAAAAAGRRHTLAPNRSVWRGYAQNMQRLHAAAHTERTGENSADAKWRSEARTLAGAWSCLGAGGLLISRERRRSGRCVDVIHERTGSAGM